MGPLSCSGVPAPACSLSGASGGSGLAWGIHMCTDICMSIPYIYGCICSCISSRASLWGQFFLGDAYASGGVEMLRHRLVPSCPIVPAAAASLKPLPGWAEPRSRKISQILKCSRDRKSLSHPVLITGWPSSQPACHTRVPRSSTVPVPVPRSCAEDNGDTDPRNLYPEINFQAIKKPPGAGFLYSWEIIFRNFSGVWLQWGAWGWGQGGGDPFSSPLQMQCYQLAARQDCWLLTGRSLFWPLPMPLVTTRSQRLLLPMGGSRGGWKSGR